jgi:hypothetical protein
MIRRTIGRLVAPNCPSERGQALVVVAIMFLILLGFAGFAVDVSSAHATRRFERSVADAAALAGAQDLQTPASRQVTNLERIAARTHALQSLVNELKATGTQRNPANPLSNCNPNSADIVDCILSATPYRAAIKTPSPSCSPFCDPAHSVQVMVRNPKFETAFARLFGQATWDVRITSVAGIVFSTKYAVITLQPPKPRNNGTDANLDKDIVVDGSCNGNNCTNLNILQGDIGTNTSATTTNRGLITLADGFYIDHYDDLSAIGDTWTKPDGIHPIGRQIGQLITDPLYPIAQFPTAPVFSTQGAGTTPCSGANFPTDYTTLLTGAVCYRPGIYTDNQGFRVGTGGGSPNVAYLMPGAYSFPTGMTIRRTLAGGLISNQPGVVLVVPQDRDIDANNAENFLLNAGRETCSADACRATPAVDFAGNQVKTVGGLTLTIEVPRDEDCFSGVTPIITPSCDVNQTTTVGIAGNGRLVVGGVIYGPSDNMNINSSAQFGYVGQVLAWSVKYTGGATLNQSYPGGAGIGILRIDSACSGPQTPCTP